MSCFDSYITTDETIPSNSGLYFNDLSGCTLSILDDLVKEDQADVQACFDYLYRKAQVNLKIDLQRKLAGRFHIDKKLLTKETSKFLNTYNSGSALAGVKISLSLAKYARVRTVQISVKSLGAVNSPQAQIFVYREDANGELLDTIDVDLVDGVNIINVFNDYEEEDLFFAYSPSHLTLAKTENRNYPSDTVCGEICEFNCLGDELGSYQQVNGGGINVKFIVECSMDKFLCDNLPIFQYALFYRIGVDTMKERIVTQKTNVSTVLTAERAAEIMKVHNDDYMEALNAAYESIKITEDPICFVCKRSVASMINLP